MSFYLYNALGFFIQLFPCTIMIFLPFSEEAYRFRRKTIFAGMAIASIVLALIFPLMLDIVLRVGPFQYVNTPSDLYMTAAILLGLSAYVWLVREAVVKKVMVFFCVMFYAASQYLLANWLGTILDSLLINTPLYQPYVPVYNMQAMLLYLITAAVLLPVVRAVVIRPLREFNREIRPENMKREFLIVILSTVVFFIMISYFSIVLITVTGKIPAWMPMFPFLITEQVIIYWLVFRESVRRQRDNERQRFLEVQRLQYEKIASEMENTSRLRHDLRHHLNTIGALNAQGKQTEIAEYLGQYGAVVDLLNEQKFSGDPVVDSILEYYLALAYDARIPVECQVTLKGRSGVDPVDMTVLLGNCLENALEALWQLPENRRRLSIEMMPAKAMLVLRIQNACDCAGESVGPTGWESFTSHKGAGYRGVGLRSVTVIAEKYGGNAQFQCADGVFTTRVILNPTQTRV